MAVAGAAITISLISLAVAVQNGETERKLVAASSWPFLVAAMEGTGLVEGSRIWSLSVSNGGVGPARIKSARVLLDGRPVHDRTELLARCCGFAGGDVAAQIAQGLISQNPIVGVLTPRDDTTVLAIRQTPINAAQWRRLDAIWPRLKLYACYCSVLGECWTTDFHNASDPRRVGQCRPSPDDYTE